MYLRGKLLLFMALSLPSGNLSASHRWPVQIQLMLLSDSFLKVHNIFFFTGHKYSENVSHPLQAEGAQKKPAVNWQLQQLFFLWILYSNFFTVLWLGCAKNCLRRQQSVWWPILRLRGNHTLCQGATKPKSAVFRRQWSTTVISKGHPIHWTC